MKRFLSIFFFFSIYLSVFVQGQSATHWGKQDIYLLKQTGVIFKLVNKLLEENPPSVNENSLARKSALLLLDGVFHDTRLDGEEVLTQFIDSKLSIVIDDLKKPLDEGMKIYKIYNHGFIIKSNSITFAFDLYRGNTMKNGNSLISDTIMQMLVEACDAMFLTHNHPDHIDPVVVKMFTEKGKPVIAPDNSLVGNDHITHIRSEDIIDKGLTVGKYKLKVTILPGHQSELINNIYVVTTPEGLTVAHTGDQYSKEDLDWLLDVNQKIPSLDVLLINCWANQLPETIDGFNPNLVLTGHENELGHTIDHREAYWLSYSILKEIKKPSSILAWGEWFWYKN